MERSGPTGRPGPTEPTRPTGPDDPQPDDWPDNWWAVYVTLARGEDQQVAADITGRHVTTVRRWIRLWRSWWGSDFLPTHSSNRKAAAANRATRSSIGSAGGGRNPARIATTHVGGGMAQLTAASRIAQANLFGATAQKAAEIIMARLDQIAASPVELGLLQPKDLVDLGRVVAMLNQQASAILGEGQSSGMGGTRADVDLTGLEAHTDQDRATLDAAEVFIRSWHADRGSEPAEVIDVAEAG